MSERTEHKHRELRGEYVDEEKPMSRSDIRLVQSAIRKGWNIPQQVLDALPTEIARIAADRSNPSLQVRAIRALDQMLRTNVTAAVALEQLEREDEGYQPSSVEVHKHEHVHIENAPIEVVRVDDWYGTPAALASPGNATDGETDSHTD